MSEQPRYKLTYFDARGLAEPIRMIFELRGIEYEDCRIPFTTFSELLDEIREKNYTLPLLEIDGEKFTQVFAILNHLGAKYDLYGADDLEMFRMHELCENFREYFNKWRPLFYDETLSEVKEGLKQKLLAIDTPRIMSMYHDVLIKNNDAGSPWFFGNKMTIADICFAHFTYNFKVALARVDLIKGYPAFQKLQDSVFSQPGIKEWIERRPESKF